MKALASIFGALALMTMGAVAQEPAPAADAPSVQTSQIVLTADTTGVTEVKNDAAPATEQAKAPAVKAAKASDAGKPVHLGTWEVILFCVVVIGVIALGIWKSKDPQETEEEKKEKGASDYFLAGRGLTWWLVGFSLLAANISTEQFVGQSGKSADWVGLAIAGYEWLAAIVLVIVAFCFLPKLLKGGVYTIPEFLEIRYNSTARTIMALATLLILVGVPTAGVIYAGAKVISVFFAGYEAFGIQFGDITTGCLIIALCATIYVFVGGLKACAWTDLFWGAALILGGGAIAYFALTELGSADPNHLIQSASANSGATVEGLKATSNDIWGGVERFFMLNEGDAVNGVNTAGGKLHMIRPAEDPEIPWTVLCLGLWIPNFFYWGLNQYIVQRALASKSLSEGQMGIVFAAFLKLLIPFVVIIPGILAYNLFRDDLKAQAENKYDDQMEAIQELEGAEKDNVVYWITDGFLVEKPEIGIQHVQHNAKLMANETVKRNGKDVKVSEIQADIDKACAALAADVADQSTTMAQRAPLVAELAGLNMMMVEAAEGNDDKYYVTDKLVGFDYDSAFATLMKKLLPGTGWTWFVLAALFGAVVSSLASMLNSASTLLTMDIYNKIRKNATPAELVKFGKIGLLICAVVSTCIAPFLDSPAFGGIFNFIQEFQGFLSPGALCVFIFGFFVPKCPRVFGVLGILIGAVLYGIFYVAMPEVAFLNRMAFSFIGVVLIGFLLTAINAARGGEAIVLPERNVVALESSGKAKVFGLGVVLITVVLYIIFW